MDLDFNRGARVLLAMAQLCRQDFSGSPGKPPARQLPPARLHHTYAVRPSHLDPFFVPASLILCTHAMFSRIAIEHHCNTQR